MTSRNMQSPIPTNEAQRLAALRRYDILDTVPEVNFDILIRVAFHALNAGAVVIELRDSNRLWFKSRIGRGVPQLHRQIAFCVRSSMRAGEPLVIEDLTLDSRFQNNPLVIRAPKLRFYAGLPLVDRDGHVLGTIAVVDSAPRQLDSSQRELLGDLSSLVVAALDSRQRTNMLTHAATTDYLTGLANRAQFEKTVAAEISHARRTGQPFSILYMDLDGFKTVNDTFGHAAGDEVLCEVARRMKALVRAEDLLARFGGDEFALFLRQNDDDSDEPLSKRMAESVRKPIALSSGQMVSVDISIGRAKYTYSVKVLANMLEQADQALYKDKQEKYNRVGNNC
ncbi:MAG: sensor domain-containing diguanylate cyclase [Gammaproteobacteria bacterium]